MIRAFKIPVLAGCFLAAFTLGVHADQINGDWCSPNGQVVSIDGAHVITPYGNQVSANHDRHHIDYQIPAGEPNAGDQFTADQLSDDKLSVKIIKDNASAKAKSEIWTSCKPTV